MILGMGWNIASFNNPEIIARFAEHYRVIAFDNRGVGRTDKPDAPFTMETMAQDTLGLMDALGIRRAHVRGGSLGGSVAQIIAAEHPERVNGLVLSGAASRYPLMTRIMVGLIPKIPYLRRQSITMAEPLFKGPYPPTENSYHNQCLANVVFDGRKYHSRIRAPTLVIGMTHDQFVPMKFTRELADGILGSRLELIDRDHLLALKEPELIIRPTLAFLAEVDAG